MSETGKEKWREDFPIQWGVDNYVTRREFTKFLVLASGAACVGNSYFVIQRFRVQQQPFPTVEVGRENEMASGQVKQFHYPTADDPALLIRLNSGEFVAYKQRCTHLSCPVHFAAAESKLICPCHHGAFDATTGRVLEGPPPRPLPRITLHIENGIIYAKGIEGA